MKERIQLKRITSFSKGSQINGDELIDTGAYAYLNGGIDPSGRWNEYNVSGETVTISEGGNSCGYVNYMKEPFWCGAHCYYLYDTIPNTQYLYYALKSQQEKLMRIRTGACMPNIKKADLGSFELIIDFDESHQKEVVSILQRVENCISYRQKELKKLGDLVKSRFVEMFGDPKINTYNYHVVNLGEHITFLTSGSRGWAKYCVENGKEWFITIKNVKDCSISVENMQSINAPSGAEAERTRVQEGDLLISITADLGRTGVVTKHIAEHGAYINQHLTCIRLDMKVLNPLYVAYFMETPAGKEQFEAKNQSAVKAGLNFNSINSLRIIIPPIDKQNEFVTFVKHVDLSRLTIQDGLNRMELLKQSLMQKFFG